MATISSSLIIESLMIDDPAAFDVQVVGFIGRDVSHGTLEGSVVRFACAFAPEVAIGRTVSLAVGRQVMVSGLVSGVAIEVSAIGLSGVFINVEALIVE